MNAVKYALGVDVGGTFTDLALVRLSDGAAFYYKTSSTPHDPSEAITTGIAELLRQTEIAARDVTYFGHGTTVATNALIVGKTARTGLVTTDGFRDVLEIRRQRQPHNYDFRMPKPPPPVPRHLRRGIRERTYLFGLSNIAPDESAIPGIVADFRREGVEAIAICFLHAYRNPAHEARIAEAVREAFPEAFVCASHEVLAEFREYERISTTVLNAMLGPVMQRYLENLERSAGRLGVIAPKILQSNGGVASPREAGRNPVRTLASGPAAGVTGAVHLCNAAGFANIITFDVGGTSTDVCLIERGEPLIRRQREFVGYPVRFPMMDVHSVGAGGGSIAWVDTGGFLHVGPQSAGAHPGPACYGRGGTEPTVTDANVLLGRLSREALLGGRMPIDAGLARKAVEEKVAKPMGLDLEEAAQAILTILNENMVQAIRMISVEQGFDPREFALVAFGGAGPLLAAPVAQQLGMSQVVVPEGPGLLCALGLLVAEIRSDFSVTRILRLDESAPETMSSVFAELEAEVRAWFDGERIEAGARRVERAVDMRYAGQSHELTIKLPNDSVAAADIDALAADFRREHARVYGYAAEAPMQLVTFRVTAKARVSAPPAHAGGSRSGAAEEAITRTRNVWFPQSRAYVETPVYERERLHAGATLHGPAIVEQMDTTTVVMPGQTLVARADGNLLLSI
jgi:N-methylhydantoinase A